MEASALLLLSVLTTSAIAVQLVRARPPELGSHLIAPGLVLAVSLGAYLVVPARAGWISLAAFCALLFVPLYAAWPMSRALALQRFDRARLFARISVALNPIPARFRALEMIGVLEAIEQGRMTVDDLDARTIDPHVRGAYLQALRAEGRFDEIVAYVRGLPAALRERDAGLAVHEARALGELGRYDEMVERAESLRTRPGSAHASGDAQMMAAALLGQVELTDHFAAQRVAFLGEEVVEYWRATARAAAGDASATERFEALARSEHRSVRRGAQRRLDNPVPVVELSAWPAARAYVDELAADVSSAAGIVAGSGRATATRLLLAMMALAFCAQIPGGTADAMNLVELGALVVPPIPGYDQPYRLLSAAFLHHGFAHFAMNTLGLWVLGRRIEGALGAPKLLAVFLGSAVLGNLAALLIMRGPSLLVGASGGVLGLLGALVGIVLVRRRSGSTRYLDGVLREVAGIAVIQVAFDLMMPNVASTAHVAGFVSGTLLGLVLAPRQP